MPQRIDLDQQAADARRPIDANWSPKKKKVVGLAAGAVALLALTGGVWAALSARQPGLPNNAEDVLSVMSSPAFEKMSSDRKSQYIAEAQRIMRDMSEEDRAKLREDERARKAMEQMRNEMFDEMARRFARGEPLQFPGAGERREGPSPEEMRRRREEAEKMSDEDRAARMEQFRQRMNQQFDAQVSGGNAQSGGLRSEMFKRGMGGMRGGGGRPGGGGGGGGGRGG